MVERTIAHTARKLAGQFYDLVRSGESLGSKIQIERRGRVHLEIEPKLFAKTYPTVKDYLAGRRHGRMERKPDGSVFHVDDGSITLETPGWMHWYALAREMLVETLNNRGTHDNIKQGIMAALVEDREKQLKQEAMRIASPKIAQRRSLPH